MVLELISASVYTKEGKEIVTKASLRICEKHLHVLMGPNGAGKSSLAAVIMGHKNYILKGKLLLDGEDISSLETHERVLKGVTLAVQTPIEIEGVRVSEIITRMLRKYNPSMTLKEATSILIDALKAVGLSEEILSREYMVGMSGGEKKKLELARILVQKPRIAILDEPDSGVDIESLPKIAQAVEKLVEEGTGVLLITHRPSIVARLMPDKVYIMVKGRIMAEGGVELLKEVERRGYTRFLGG